MYIYERWVGNISISEIFLKFNFIDFGNWDMDMLPVPLLMLTFWDDFDEGSLNCDYGANNSNI